MENAAAKKAEGRMGIITRWPFIGKVVPVIPVFNLLKNRLRSFAPFFGGVIQMRFKKA